MAAGHEMLRAEKQGEFSQGPIDVARSDGKHGIAGPHFAKQPLDALLERAAINNVLVAGGANRFRQGRGVNAANRCFTRGVDIRDDQEVRLIEGAAEVIPEVLRARKTMPRMVPLISKRRPTPVKLSSPARIRSAGTSR